MFAYSNPTIFDLAAVYGYGLAKNHPFVDGNKRTAFMAMYTFLGLNNYWLEVAEMEVVVKMESLAMGTETQDSIALWLSDNSVN